jgi:hypothetical protein
VVDEMDYDEAAALMGTTEHNARIRVSRRTRGTVAMSGASPARRSDSCCAGLFEWAVEDSNLQPWD